MSFIMVCIVKQNRNIQRKQKKSFVARFDGPVNPKNASENVVCCSRLMQIIALHYRRLSIEANSVDKNRLLLYCSHRSSPIWVHAVCHRGFLNISADEKVDDFCCDLRINPIITIIDLISALYSCCCCCCYLLLLLSIHLSEISSCKSSQCAPIGSRADMLTVCSQSRA